MLNEHADAKTTHGFLLRCSPIYGALIEIMPLLMSCSSTLFAPITRLPLTRDSADHRWVGQTSDQAYHTMPPDGCRILSVLVLCIHATIPSFDALCQTKHTMLLRMHQYSSRFCHQHPCCSTAFVHGGVVPELQTHRLCAAQTCMLVCSGLTPTTSETQSAGYAR